MEIRYEENAIIIDGMSPYYSNQKHHLFRWLRILRDLGYEVKLVPRSDKNEQTQD